MLNEFNKKIRIGSKTIGNGYEPYIIAEMACAHNGNFEQVKALIDASKVAGADATQLQFFDINEVVTPVNELKEILDGIVFSPKEWTELFHYGKSKGIDVWVCTYDLPSVELAIKLKADGIKLNSADLSNPEVVEAVAASGIPFTLGTGASTLEEIQSGLSSAYLAGARDAILMHGVQNFPTKIEDLNISRIDLLKNTFDMPVGYHDHVDGEDSFGKVVDLIAIGLGANVLEKHIALDRSEKGLDYQAALEPNELKKYVERVKLAFKAYGSKIPKPFTASDLKYRKFQKKSIVAKKKLKAGDILKREDVFFSRNSEPGIAPIYFSEMENKKMNKDIEQYANILREDIDA